MEHVPSYSYSALPEPATTIRLLTVQCTLDAGNTITRYTLAPFPLAQAPSYDAISYTWGPRLPTEVVYIAGRRLAVRESCARVLRQLAYFQTSRHYWIDAICINQADADEKNVQVAMMAQIYRTARRVLVCLAAVDVDTVHAVGALHSRDLGDSSADAESHVPGGEAEAGLSGDRRVRYHRGLAKLTMLPYFRRVWIVQELLLAQRVFLLYGYHMVRASRLHSRLLTIVQAHDQQQAEDSLRKAAEEQQQWDHVGAMEALEGLDEIDREHRKDAADIELLSAVAGATFELSRDAINLLAQAAHNGAAEDSHDDLSDTIRYCRTKECEDPRDTVFGMLALIDWHNEPPIQPDYGVTTFELAVRLCARGLEGRIVRQLIRNLRLGAQSPGVVEGVSIRQSTIASGGRARSLSPNRLAELKRNMVAMGQSIGECSHRLKYVGERVIGLAIGTGENWVIPAEDMAKPYRRIIVQDSRGDGGWICIAHASPSVQAGDWIAHPLDVPDHRIHHPTSDGFVLRQWEDGDVFMIVGRAVVWDRLTTRLMPGSAQFEIAFDPEDFVTYAATSLVDETADEALDPDQETSPFEEAWEAADVRICKTACSSLAIKRDPDRWWWLFSPHHTLSESQSMARIGDRLRETAAAVRVDDDDVAVGNG